MEQKFKVGNYVIAKLNGEDITKGKKYKVVRVDYDGDITILDDAKETHDVDMQDFELATSQSTPKVNFLLKYDLDEDPIEEFETMKEVDDRIKQLVEEEDSLQKDSIVIYEIKSKHEVKIETKISKKLIK